MITAHLRIQTPTLDTSSAIVQGVQPDNEKLKGLRIRSRSTRRSASFSIIYSGRIETFISTLDDLLRCIQAASASLEAVRKRETSNQ